MDIKHSKKGGLVLVLLFLMAAPAASFFPLDFLASVLASGRSHEAMTRGAMESMDRELFDVTEPTRSMRWAIIAVVLANALVDTDQVTKKHFDGEDFSGGQGWITGRRAEIIASLREGNTWSARFALGQALHTLQDFYSHSNWIELHGATVNPAIGQPGQSVGPTAGGSSTCQDCDPRLIPLCNDCSHNLTTSLLTSGYFDVESRPAGKCDHGGPSDGSATDPILSYKFGINKDSGSCLFSPRHDLHAQAAQAAEAASLKFIRDLQDDLTPSQMRLLLGGGPTLAIAIDTTGSMTSIIEQVKARAIAMIDARLGTLEEPSKYVLVPFNDPSVGPVTVTADPEEMKAAIRSLTANGGGDCPEMAFGGMMGALGAMDSGGHLFVFTDASAKDAARAGEVASLALESGVEIESIRFGTCSSRSAVDPGQQPDRFTASNWRDLAAEDSGFHEVSEASGGQVFDLLISETSSITDLADLAARSNSVGIASLVTTLSGPVSTWSIPADSGLERMTFSVSGTPDMVIRRPDASVVQPGEPGVATIDLTTGRILSVVDPIPGAWSVELMGTGPVSLEVMGEGPLDLASFDFVEMKGRPGHEGWFPITGLPTRGTHTVSAALAGDFFDVMFELRRKDGTVLRTFSLEQGPGQQSFQFSGELQLPGEPFLVYAFGTDGEGAPFQRLLPGAVGLQSVAIRPKSVPAELRPGQTAEVVFQVTNLGTAGAFNVSISDDKGYVGPASPAEFSLDPKGVLDVTVQVAVPAGAPAGSVDTIVAVVRRTSDPSVSNFAIVSSLVGASEADVRLSKTANVSGPVGVGGEITYTLTLTNDGPGSATSLVVTDALPSQVALLRVEPPCAATTAPVGTVVWDVGSLPPGESASCSFVVRVLQPSLIVNTASATLAESDPATANNSASAVVNALNGIAEVPTLSQWGLGLMAGALALGGALRVRRLWNRRS